LHHHDRRNKIEIFCGTCLSGFVTKDFVTKNKNTKHKTREILVFEESSTCSSRTLINKSPHFILGVKANAQLKSSIPIGEKVEISPKQRLYTRSQG
jgi:hypothetical protein